MHAVPNTVERELCPEPATVADIATRLRNAAIALATLGRAGARHRARLLHRIGQELHALAAACHRLAEGVTHG